MKLKEILKNKKVMAMVLAGVICSSTFATIKHKEYTSEANMYNVEHLLGDYFDEVSIETNTSNETKKELENFIYNIKETYGNPDKSENLLDEMRFYMNENLEVKKADLVVYPGNITNYKSEIDKDAKWDNVLECSKDLILSNIETINKFMNDGNFNHVRVLLRTPLTLMEDARDNIEMDFVKIDNDTIVKFKYEEGGNKDVYLNVKDNKVNLISDAKIIFSVNKAILDNHNVDKLGFFLRIDTLKEGEFESIANSTIDIKSEERDLAERSQITALVGTELFDKLSSSTEFTNDKEVDDTLKALDKQISGKFGFIDKKSLYTIVEVDNNSTSIFNNDEVYIAKKEVSEGKYRYSYFKRIYGLTREEVKKELIKEEVKNF